MMYIMCNIFIVIIVLSNCNILNLYHFWSLLTSIPLFFAEHWFDSLLYTFTYNCDFSCLAWLFTVYVYSSYFTIKTKVTLVLCVGFFLFVFCLFVYIWLWIPDLISKLLSLLMHSVIWLSKSVCFIQVEQPTFISYK